MLLRGENRENREWIKLPSAVAPTQSLKLHYHNIHSCIPVVQGFQEIQSIPDISKPKIQCWFSNCLFMV